MVESYRTERGPRQRVVVWLWETNKSGRLGVEEFAKGDRGFQQDLFEESDPEWGEVNIMEVRVENIRDFGGPWIALEMMKRLGLAYVLWRALGSLYQRMCLSGEPRKVFHELAQIKLTDLILSTRNGKEIRLRCVWGRLRTTHQRILLQKLKLVLPRRFKMKNV